MSDRRLVGIDLGIASAHAVRVLDGEGVTLRRAAHRRGPLKARDHPHPQALRRPRALPAPHQPLNEIWSVGLAQ